MFDVELREAIQRGSTTSRSCATRSRSGEIVAWFQPEVDLRTGRIVGAEALARWEHPERGVLDAWKFVPLAEETGLVFALDDAIVAERGRRPGRELAAAGVGDGFRIWCNVSARS